MNWTACQERRKLGESGYSKMNKYGSWKNSDKTFC